MHEVRASGSSRRLPKVSVLSNVCIRRPRARVAIRNAQRDLRIVLDRWETAYRKENFYRGIRILLELQREGYSSL
jgi:hypothetical protein